MSKLQIGFKRAFCPACNTRILEGDEHTNVIVKCSSCKILVKIVINKDGVFVEKLEKGKNADK